MVFDDEGRVPNKAQAHHEILQRCGQHPCLDAERVRG
jgi:hypothetical protein